MTLSSPPAPQGAVLFQVRGNAEALDSLATALPQAWRCPCAGLIHPSIQQRLFWLIEVADSSFQYDCGVKAPAYAKSGIAEYWVLDVNQRQLHVHRSPTAEGYQSRLVPAAGDQVTPVAFPDCSIAVTQLLHSKQG